MACMAPAANAKQAVLDTLQRNEYRPMDLLVELGRHGYTDSETKKAISELLHEGAIELTSGRFLKPASQHVA